MKDYLITLRKNLVTYMQLNGLTQTSLAEKIGVTNATVSKWVLGKSEPNIKYIDALCEVFRCTRSELIDFEQSPETVHENEFARRMQAYMEKLNEEGMRKTLQYMEDLNDKYFKGDEK